MELTPYDKEYQDCKEVFLATFKPLAEEFYQEKKSQFTRSTATRYYLVADAWIEYLHGYTDCLEYKDIKVSDVNSKFFAAVRYQELYGFDSSEVKSKLKKFVYFLQERGYENPNVIKAINK